VTYQKTKANWIDSLDTKTNIIVVSNLIRSLTFIRPLLSVEAAKTAAAAAAEQDWTIVTAFCTPNDWSSSISGGWLMVLDVCWVCCCYVMKCIMYASEQWRCIRYICWWSSVTVCQRCWRSVRAFLQLSTLSVNLTITRPRPSVATWPLLTSPHPTVSQSIDIFSFRKFFTDLCDLRRTEWKTVFVCDRKDSYYT